MASITNLTNVWNNIKEIDLRPIREEALAMVKIALVGAPGSGRAALAENMRRDPLHVEQIEKQSPVLILDTDAAGPAGPADLIILMLNAAEGTTGESFEREKDLARRWADSNKRVLVFVNQAAGSGSAQAFWPWRSWTQRRVIFGSVDDTQFLLEKFAPAVIELLPEQLLALGRQFPLFRAPIAHHLVNETCFSNAAYALSTGLAQIVPIFNIPLNVADMVVLTKAQAFLVYRLGLALGLSTNWQDYIAEFGSVLGGGFLWRQLARGLVGLIPAWGIVPKVAVAYAGTYVVGNTILQWYQTGRHISARQMRELYVQAFTRGKTVARAMLNRVPRPRFKLPKPKFKIARPRFGLRLPWSKRAPAAAQLPATVTTQVCPNCQRSSSADASYCQYCGHSFGADTNTAPAHTVEE